MADGYIEFSTKLDNSDLEKNLKESESKIERLKRKLENDTDKKSIIEAQMERTKDEIAKTEAQLDGLYAKLEQIEQARTQDPASFIATSEETDRIKSQIADLEKANDKNLGTWDKQKSELAEINDEITLTSGKLETAQQKASQLGAEYSKAHSSGTASFSNAISSMDKRFDSFAKKINTRIKRLFVFSFIFAALATFKKYLTGLVKEDEAFNQSVNGLTATLSGMVTPLVQFVIPVLTAIVNVITAMVTTLARLVDMVFKTDLVGSISRARSAAQAAEALEDEADATNDLAKAQGKAARQLMAFDEINAMQGDTASDAATSLGSQAAGTDTAAGMPGMDIGKIDQTLAQIMIIVGTALLAVGVILAFSGINIPLGITLMAIGALMLYTAVSEQWDKLPNEVRTTLTLIMTIIASALIVIGVVLCLTGHMPLGIAFIIAGAVVFVTAVALNWDALVNNVDHALDKLGMVIGAMIAVIGVVLCVTGHIPLGIGAIIVGIAIFGVSAVNIYGETLPNDVRYAITAIMAILAPALVVLGAILCVTGQIPLGIAAIIGGIAIFGITAVGTDWNSLPNSVRNTITIIMSIIGGALLAVGVILCITGVGIPIGIACILAGAASLVSAATMNWDFLRQKVAEIWNGIVQFWNQHIAHVFTWEFWSGIFRSIINGLIWAINQGLNAVGGFINMITGGITDVLNWLGVTGWSFTVSMPQIPYLAQGAVIPPNRRFMAVLGDQTNGRNLEAPESLIRQIVREEAGGISADSLQQAFMAALVQALPLIQSQGTGNDDGDAVMVLRVGNEELARAVSKGKASMLRRGLLSPELLL